MMTSKSVLLAGLGFLIRAAVLAQTPSPALQKTETNRPSDTNVPRWGSVGKLPPGQLQMMSEDIEIMRRILNRKLSLWPGMIAMNSNCITCHSVSANHGQNLGRSMNNSGDFTFLNSL